MHRLCFFVRSKLLHFNNLHVAVLWGAFGLTAYDVALPVVAQEAVAQASAFDIEQMKEELSKDTAVLVDVREEQEWREGHLKLAELLPLSELKQTTSFAELALRVPKDKTVYLHCQSGIRCKTAAKILAEKGWKTVVVPTPYPELVVAGLDVDTSVKSGINESFMDPNLSVEEYLERFEVESREVYANRDEILKTIALKDGDTVIDLGAGTGFYTFLFAKEVGDQGDVLALDIAPNFVQHINESAKQSKISNVTAQLSKDSGFAVLPETVDLIFVCDVYHHFEYPERMLSSIEKSLVKGGRLVIIDFKREEGVSSDWVLNHVRAGADVVKSEVESAGMKLLSLNNDLLRENYIMIFEKL